MPEQILAGKYLVQDEIAKGGMGVIYKALDRTLNRVVAIKLVHAHLSGDASFVERFLREARAMARLQHDNIVTIYAVEENQGTQILVMEYFQSSNLRVLTRNQPRLPFRDVVSITHQLASALAYAHGHGIIHRDIKPANVLVDKRGKAKLTDFGIAAALDEASITSTGQVIGTPEYMSPEQARGTTLDGRSDLYSVGIMLYEMLTGNIPYAETSKASILGKLAFGQQELPLPFPSDIPSLLQGVVRDLLRRQPDERIPDADTLANQLHEILHTLPTSPTGPTSGESDATVLGVQTLVAKAPDTTEPGPPSVIASGSLTETRVAPSMATRNTRVPPPPAVPRFPAPPHLEETTILSAQPPTSVGSIKESPSAAPAPPISTARQASPLFPILAGGLVAVLALSSLVYYLANREIPAPDASEPRQPTSRIEHPASKPIEDRQGFDGREVPTQPPDPKTAMLEAKLKNREDSKSKLEGLLLRVSDQLQAENHTSECPKIKALQIATYAKFQDSVRDLNTIRQDLGREEVPLPLRPNQLDLQCGQPKSVRPQTVKTFSPSAPAQTSKPSPGAEPKHTAKSISTPPLPPSDEPTKTELPKPTVLPPQPPVEVAKAFPDAQLRSLLEKFTTAYENHDLATIQSISRMSEERLRNVQVMFAHYETIRASIKDLVQTEQGASATLFLESVTTAGGERVDLSPLARKFKLKIPRQGAESQTIIW